MKANKETLLAVLNFLQQEEGWSLKEIITEVVEETELLRTKEMGENTLSMDECGIEWGESEVCLLETFVERYTGILIDKICNVVHSFIDDDIDCYLDEEEVNSITECEDDGMKEFYGEVSLAARIYFRTKGASKEEVKEKILSVEEIILKLCEEGLEKNRIELDTIDWNLIEQAQQGNIRESYIDDIEIYEEE